MPSDDSSAETRSEKLRRLFRCMRIKEEVAEPGCGVDISIYIHLEEYGGELAFLTPSRG